MKFFGDNSSDLDAINDLTGNCYGYVGNIYGVSIKEQQDCIVNWAIQEEQCLLKIFHADIMDDSHKVKSKLLSILEDGDIVVCYTSGALDGLGRFDRLDTYSHIKSLFYFSFIVRLMGKNSSFVDIKRGINTRDRNHELWYRGPLITQFFTHHIKELVYHPEENRFEKIIYDELRILQSILQSRSKGVSYAKITKQINSISNDAMKVKDYFIGKICRDYYIAPEPKEKQIIMELPAVKSNANNLSIPIKITKTNAPSTPQQNVTNPNNITVVRYGHSQINHDDGFVEILLTCTALDDNCLPHGDFPQTQESRALAIKCPKCIVEVEKKKK